MERVECITDAAKELDYPEMKPEQLEVAATFIEGRDVFFRSAYWLWQEFMLRLLATSV